MRKWLSPKVIFLKIKDFRNKISGQIIRLALMSTHYKQPLDWNDKLLSDCENTLDKWYQSLFI